MRSSDASSALRLELPASRLAAAWLLSLGAMATVALLLSALPMVVAAGLLVCASGLVLRQWRMPSPRRLRCGSDGTLWLDWPDGREEAVEMRGERQVGALSVLWLRGERRTHRLVLWPDMLCSADRRALRRRLRGRVPAPIDG